MEHRDQKHESHGVHVCNKCGWSFPNPHPSAKHRRAHKKVCGKIEGFKSVESEANTHLTLSDDDGDQQNSSPKGLGGSCNDKVIDGMRKKSKGSKDEVFSDAVAEFSEGVGRNKSVGDSSDSVSTTEMVSEGETNSSQTLKDTDINDLVPPSSSSTENREVETVAETTINQSGSLRESEIKQEIVNLEIDVRSGDSVVLLDDHMNTTATGDLYPIEPEMVISALQQGRNVNSVENAPQCSLPSPDRRLDEKKNEGSGANVPEIAASSGEIDDDKSEPVPLTMEETTEMPTEPTAHNGTLLSMADDDTFVQSETAPIVVVSDVKPSGLTQITSDAGKEIESWSSDNLLETGKIKEGKENVNFPSVSSDLNTVDRPGDLVEDLKDHKEVKLTNFVIQSPCEGDVVSEDNFKDPIPEQCFSTFQPEPFDQASELASFDMKTVENKEKQEIGGNKVPVDAEADCCKHSGQEVKEHQHPIQEADATRVKDILSENEREDRSLTLSDGAVFGIDSIPLASFSPEVDLVAPSKNSLDTFSENATEVLSDDNSVAAPADDRMNLGDNEVGIGGVHLADDDKKKVVVYGTHTEDSVQVHLPANVHEKDDSGGGQKDKFDNLDIAGVECKKGLLEENLSAEIDSTLESTTDGREIKCISTAEEIADESPRKSSGTESADVKKLDVSLGDTRQSVKEDNPDGVVHVGCVSEVNADDQLRHATDFNSVQNTSDVKANEEANLVLFSNESVAGRSATSQDGSAKQLVGDAAGTTSETWQEDGGKHDIEPKLISSLIDISVDSSSITDSLEGNWGSISVLSTQSDLPAIIDAEATRHARAEETCMKRADAATERQHSDRSDLFEPPSFMTLVEPNGGGIQNSAESEIQTAQNREQPNSASWQPGWFPTYTHVANDSLGRKKNEAIIAKVTNWSTGKPHTALKNLLDDAALEHKQKAPTPKENLASMIQKDENPTKNGSIDPTVDSVTQPRSPTAQSGNKEIANEWNSPARYPSDIRRERRKGKPYWAQFVCCSSVH